MEGKLTGMGQKNVRFVDYTNLWSRRGNATLFGSLASFFQYAIGNFFDVLLKNESQMTTCPVICWRHEMDPVGMMGQLITFFK